MNLNHKEKIFNPVRKISKVANHILKKRYFWDGENKWEDVANRVVDFVLKDEEKDTKEIIRNMILNTYFVPNSPCLVNANRSPGGLLACFVVDFEDSIEEIFKTKLNFALIARKGGGCGTSLSKIRPEGSSVAGSTYGYAGGPIRFADTICHDAEALTQAGFRSMAIMLTCSVYHPDIIKFITAKQEEDKMTNANISVTIDDAFMNDVINNEKYWTRFGGKNYDEYKARDIFDLIVEGMWKNGEPGVLFYNRMNEAPYKYLGEELIATNPCLFKDSWLIGNKKIEKISESTEFKTWKTGIKKSIKLITNAGYEIITTPDHKIMLKNGEFIKAKDSLGKRLAWSIGNRYLEKIDDNYLLAGFLFGDGFICGGGLGVSVSINPNKESEVVTLLKDFGFYRQDCGIYYINRNTLETRLGFSLDFIEGKIYEKEIPDKILSLDNNKLGSFIRGLFEANGSVTKLNSQISLKATNKETIKKVQIILSAFGIRSWIVRNKPQKIRWDNGTYTSRVSYNLQVAPRNAQLFKEHIGFISKYKNSRIRKFDKNYNGKLKVKEIIDVGKKEVWDFKSPTSHTIANGIMAHNCSEQPLSSNGSCNLGSLDLSKFVTKNKKIDWEKLELASKLGVKFLDTVIDKTSFPTREIEQWAKDHRPIGLGIMGYADMLLMMELAYGSQEANELLEKILSFIYNAARSESKRLGIERGIPKLLEKNLPEPRRNITLTTIAPTGTVSLIAGCSSGIEPIFSEIVVRNDKTGTYTFVNDLAEKEYFRCAVSSNGSKEVTWEEHIDTLSACQKHIDSGVSKTVNFPKGTHRETIGKAIIKAWEQGCKGLAVYRNGSRKTEVLTPKNVKQDRCPICGKEMIEVNGKQKCISCNANTAIEDTTTYYD